MEMYNVPEHQNAEAYLIQGTDSNQHLASPPFEQFEAMYNEGAPEFIVEQGMYYPTATNYGYICTGFESPGDWDDHQRIFGLDGQEFQYAGAQTESLPYVYYTPSYGYAQSPFNPYNPYIPGAMIGADGQFVDTQQYYDLPSYENPMSSPAYYPMLVQPNSTPEPFFDAGSFSSNVSDGLGPKPKLSSASTKPASNLANSFTRVREAAKANIGPSKQPAARGIATSDGFSGQASSQVLQGRAQVVDNVPNGKALLRRVAHPSSNGVSNFGATAHGRATVDKVWPKVNYGRVLNDVSGNPNALTEQNRGPRTSKSKHNFSVKAYTTRAGDTDAQGNIIIYTGQYNKDGFPVDYVKAKFFVIKSYSEDDVHKSIKYNVWSSTPNGNKKLDSAYADAQRVASGDPKGCPVFLFFSVNASGLFCGVAEMTGPVDFYKDMDFWQQDKWSGSFPVKWHIIKDVPNPNFRHIILENNENKPVTNSRDTQEIRYKPGIEMLKIFKNHTLRTSLLDDFMYYENRQKIMHEERARRLFKSYESPFLVPTLDPPHKLNQIMDLPSSENEKIIKHNNLSNSDTKLASTAEPVLSESNVSKTSISKDKDNPNKVDGKDNNLYQLKIGSLTINPKPMESVAVTSTVATTKPVDVVTVGSMPVKVNGFAEPLGGFLTVGTIPLDPRALKLDEAGGLTKGGSRHG